MDAPTNQPCSPVVEASAVRVFNKCVHHPSVCWLLYQARRGLSQLIFSESKQRQEKSRWGSPCVMDSSLFLTEVKIFRRTVSNCTVWVQLFSSHNLSVPRVPPVRKTWAWIPNHQLTVCRTLQHGSLFPFRPLYKYLWASFLSGWGRIQYLVCFF